MPKQRAAVASAQYSCWRETWLESRKNQVKYQRNKMSRKNIESSSSATVCASATLVRYTHGPRIGLARAAQVGCGLDFRIEITVAQRDRRTIHILAQEHKIGLQQRHERAYTLRHHLVTGAQRFAKSCSASNAGWPGCMIAFKYWKSGLSGWVRARALYLSSAVFLT